MSAFTPTPGPWIAQRDPDGHGEDWVIGFAGAPIDCVATCWEKDARLIASAPDLLGIAERAVDLIGGELVGAEWKEACHLFVKDARAAIAKATQP